MEVDKIFMKSVDADVIFRMTFTDGISADITVNEKEFLKLNPQEREDLWIHELEVNPKFTPNKKRYQDAVNKYFTKINKDLAEGLYE